MATKRRKRAKRTNKKSPSGIQALSHKVHVLAKKVHKLDRRVFKKKYASKASEADLAAKYG